MKCPLLSAGEYTRNVSTPTSSCDCLKEECAWWDKTRSQCAILRLSINLEAITVSMITLINSMRQTKEGP